MVGAMLCATLSALPENAYRGGDDHGFSGAPVLDVVQSRCLHSDACSSKVAPLSLSLYIYIYLFIYTYFSLSLSIYIYIYIYVCIIVCIYYNIYRHTARPSRCGTSRRLLPRPRLVLLDISIYTSLSLSIYIYIQLYIYIHIYIYIYIYICIYNIYV